MQHHPGGPVVPSGRRSGLPSGVVVLLWVFPGWPLSWVLLFAYWPLGLLFGIGITILMIVLLATSSGRSDPAPPVVMVVGAPPFPVPPVPVMTPLQRVRLEVEALATIDAVGGCAWCGSPWAHVNDGGYPVHPRHWHAAEVEERIAQKIASPERPQR